jgi:hypothetical protein
MNAKADDLEITWRPPWYMLAFWFLGTGAMLVFGLFVVGPVLDVPTWVRCFFLAVPLLGLLVGLQLAFAVVRVNHEGLSSRHHVRWFTRWKDVQAWSQLGHQGEVYLRTADGRLHGFSSWCVYGARWDQLASALEQQLGPGVAWEAMAVPRPFGGVIR